MRRRIKSRAKLLACSPTPTRRWSFPRRCAGRSSRMYQATRPNLDRSSRRCCQWPQARGGECSREPARRREWLSQMLNVVRLVAVERVVYHRADRLELGSERSLARGGAGGGKPEAARLLHQLHPGGFGLG